MFHVFSAFHQFRWVEYLNVLILKLINGLIEFKQQTQTVSLREPLKYSHKTRLLCMNIKSCAEVLKFWMEHELKDSVSFDGKRYKLFRIFPNIHQLQRPNPDRQQQKQQQIDGSVQSTLLSKLWEKKNQ